ncbi:MAG: hypothetical protein GOU97_01580 [Nanoarchaeota archaeon]|nr:hypothetical protein [Nanoarchaeota archaeon]
MDEKDVKKILESISLEKNHLIEAILSLFADKQTGASVKLKELEINLGDYQIILSGDVGFNVKTRRKKE